MSLVLQDMNFSRRTTGEEGLELLSRIKSRHPRVPVLLIPPLMVKPFESAANWAQQRAVIDSWNLPPIQASASCRTSTSPRLPRSSAIRW